MKRHETDRSLSSIRLEHVTERRPSMPRDHLPTVIAIAVVTYAFSIMLHEGAHAAAGLAVGGDPTLIGSASGVGSRSDTPVT